MSYDCSIEKDRQHSQQLDLEELKALLAQLPHMQLSPTNNRSFLYDDGRRSFEFYLDLVDDDEGDSLLYDPVTHQDLNENDPRIQGKVNIIESGCSWNRDEILDLWDACFPIASLLGWQVYSDSTGEYIEEY